jgi:hypothetical protein
MDDPAQRAEAMVDAYKNNFVGRVGPAGRSVASRYATTSGADESLVGIRGPYLQALDVPNWSEQSWREFCRNENVNPLIQDAFSDLGFRRLYRFQERSVSTVKEGHDTVVTAATGRGKTEAWLIPILDQILQQKRDEEEQSVKALLIYPTKALAQDQFKRLVQYLYRINEKWPSSEQITIGIYDGDTPTNVGSNAQGYLQSSFKYFKCPGRNEDLEKCQTCGQGVRIHHAGQRYELEPEKRQCIEDVPLDFIKLTKHRILSEGVDILLTNPDTINRKLVNINAPDEHETFIYQPDFLVFDEVHTYDGLFGSFTATLTKRIRALRSARDRGELQVIASSATVDNDLELFRKVSGARSIKHVDEDPRDLSPDSSNTLPPELIAEELTEEDLIAFARNERVPAPLSRVAFDVDATKHDNERLRELLQDALFDYLTASSEDPIVNVVQRLHQELYADPRPHREFLSFLQSEFGVDEPTAELLLGNFQTLGTFSGLLENRTHLFSWPIDGFYTCAACDAVYRSPRESCSDCGFSFVTRSAYCRGCADEALIAWYCPQCEQLEPYQPSDEGEQTFEDDHVCQRCLQGENGVVRTLRVTFHPKLECQECGTIEERSPTQDCDDCGADMIHTDPETHTCPNPACKATVPHQSGCSECGGRQRPLTGSKPITCPSCGRTHNNDTTCVCGTDVLQTRFLPWVCRNDGCDRTYFEAPSNTCDCGSSHTFAKRGLFEVFKDIFCEECGTAFINERGCDCAVAERAREGVHESFMTFEPDGTIRSVSSIPSVAPCRHGGLPYHPDRRYDELVRGPGNLAVTTSQYLLRDVADDEGVTSAKQLAFADSHRDMKELDRDFRDPEAGTLLDQCLVEHIQTDSKSWVSLQTVVDKSLEHIDDLDKELAPPQDVQNLTFDLRSELVGNARRHMETTAAIRDRLRRRAIPHRYSPRYREFGGSLADVGVIDYRIDPDIYERLSHDERAIAVSVLDAGNDVHVEELDAASYRSTDALKTALEDSEAFSVDSGYVQFNPEAIHLAIAGEDDGLRYLTSDGTIEHSIASQFEMASDSAIPFDTTLSELADPSHPRFDARAFRVIHSEPRILLSRVYHGMTDKRERRELEYLFREGNYPNFLSSGPTMELGVDIGALDSLLLYGTPPNMNSYLQRIGRAGRSSNTSLVHSVSQRNPIDYYYYDHPTDLMAADPQPVPLKEFNREVLRVSLTWSVFDYIAANFVIPWDVKQRGRYKTVSGGDTFEPKKPESTDDTAKLTHVMSARTSALALDTDHSQFDVLETIVHDYRSEIESHLRSLLEYKYCTLCSQKYDRSDPIERCQDEHCDGPVRDAVTEFGALASEAVDEFAERYLHGFETYLEDLQSEINDLDQRTTQVERDRSKTSSGREAQRLRKEHEELLDRKSALQNRKERVETLSYVEFLKESRQSRYAFDMRTVDESVSVSLVDADGDGYTTLTVGDDDGRSIRMAISELHPKGAYLDSGDTYVVAHLSTDDYASTEIRKRVRDTGAGTLAEEFICPSCDQPSPTTEPVCDCDSDESVTELQLVSPESVTAHRSDLLLSNGLHPASELYERSDTEVQNTYAERETEVLSFESEESFVIQSASEGHVGSLQYGSFTVLVYASSFRAKYQNGAIDTEPLRFEVCGDPDCTGVVYDDEEGSHCSADADHRPDGEEGSQYVRLGYAYETDGVRIDLGNSGASHAFAHGCRLALQFLGGVSIRDLTEVVHDGSSMVDVFDSQEGGAGIARLLVSDGDGDNFETAIDLMRSQFACDCGNGCPLCVYQYGCDTYNQSDTFDRGRIAELLDDSYLELVQPTPDL